MNSQTIKQFGFTGSTSKVVNMNAIKEQRGLLPQNDGDRHADVFGLHGKMEATIVGEARGLSASKEKVDPTINLSEPEPMQLSREELQAHLAANKAEVNAIASEMRREMAEFRAVQAQQFATLSTSLSDIKGEIASLRGEAAGNKDGMTGQIEGLKSAISTMQWMVGTVLAMIGIAVAVIAIPGIEKII